VRAASLPPTYTITRDVTDPRPSLEERYANQADYVNSVASAAKRLAADRLLLDEDVQAYISKAQMTPVRN
jgi:hypothetical protein